MEYAKQLIQRILYNYKSVLAIRVLYNIVLRGSMSNSKGTNFVIFARSLISLRNARGSRSIRVYII